MNYRKTCYKLVFVAKYICQNGVFLAINIKLSQIFSK